MFFRLITVFFTKSRISPEQNSHPLSSGLAIAENLEKALGKLDKVPAKLVQNAQPLNGFVGILPYISRQTSLY